MILLVASTLVLWAQEGAKLDWKKDYAEALREAKKADRYVVVHFSGPG